jgi:hypothetical protein
MALFGIALLFPAVADHLQGVVAGQQLYQLIRQQGSVDDRTFEIRFLDPGVQAFAFTFG